MTHAPTTRARFEALRAFLARINAGRLMKAPGATLGEVIYREPAIYTAFYPAWKDSPRDDASSAPSILMMLAPSQARSIEEERFDQRNNIGRPRELGGRLGVTLEISVYEPGVRMPGFQGNEPELLRDPDAEGFFTLTDWMDDISAALLAAQVIPGSDLYLMEGSLQYSSCMDGGYIADTRPLYMGTMTMMFGHYARLRPDEGEALERALDEE